MLCGRSKLAGPQHKAHGGGPDCCSPIPADVAAHARTAQNSSPPPKQKMARKGEVDEAQSGAEGFCAPALRQHLNIPSVFTPPASEAVWTESGVQGFSLGLGLGFFRLAGLSKEVHKAPPALRTLIERWSCAQTG